MFNTNAQCYQNISQVLLTSAFILWPTCTRGFGIREKSDAVCGFLCGFAIFRPPLHPPLLSMLHAKESGISSGGLGLWLACTFTFPLLVNKKVVTCIITICQCYETGDWKNENNLPHCEESIQPATNKNNITYIARWCADNRPFYR